MGAQEQHLLFYACNIIVKPVVLAIIFVSLINLFEDLGFTFNNHHLCPSYFIILDNLIFLS